MMNRFTYRPLQTIVHRFLSACMLLALCMLVGASTITPAAAQPVPMPGFAPRGTPTNLWAVQLAPGIDPNAFAAQRGYLNRGQIGSLTGYYLLEVPGMTGRADSITTNLLNAGGVLYAQQQFARAFVNRNTNIPAYPLTKPTGWQQSIGLPRLAPTDPLYSQQWHFNNTGQAGGNPDVDINAEPAWDIATGTGVVIGIVDEGIEYTHPDIAPNWNGGVSYDHLDIDGDVFPTAGESHGTAVAGIAAAADDGAKCGVGMAFNAQIAGLRLTAGAFTDAQAAGALSHQPQLIDIYNNSWGPVDDGATFEPAGDLTRNAIQNGATTGRGGLGNLYFWSSGAGGSNSDHLGADGYNNNRYVMTIAAATDVDTIPTYGEPGPQNLVHAPSNGGSGTILMTDRTGANGYNTGTGDLADADCTSQGGGTSATAPLAAGVGALMLEANPALTWRDVVAILIETAVVNDVANPFWTTNGAGYAYNKFYGFGRIDAHAAVLAAQTWNNFTAEQVLTSADNTVGTLLPDNDVNGVSIPVAFGSSITVETVEVIIDITHQRRGDLIIEIISPSGTVSRVLDNRPLDNGVNGINAYPLVSREFWGESSVGTWSVRVIDNAGGNTGTFDAFTLNVYGRAPGAFTNCAAVTTIPTTECDALVALYNSTNGVTWTAKANWLSDDDPCTWGGVECLSGSVVSVVLPINNLTGTLPAEIGDLTAVETLNFTQNQLSGSIPPELGTLSDLTFLGLSENNLTGSIPAALGGLSLQHLNLRDNQLTGTIPPELGSLTVLQFLDLSGNQLSGAVPPEIGNLDNLGTLNLNGNTFAGELPDTLPNLTNLSAVNVGYNALYSTNAAVQSFLDTVSPGWDQTQTVFPGNVDATSTSEGLFVTWTAIPYIEDGGYYTVTCNGDLSGSQTLTVSLTTVDKASSEAVFAGLPTGLYVCDITTTTPPHALNASEITSIAVGSPNVPVSGAVEPPNDDFANAYTFSQINRQHYIYNFDGATTGAQESAPPTSAVCDIDIAPGSGAIHYLLTANEGFAPLGRAGDGRFLGGKIILRTGGPGWYRPRNPDIAADTAVAVYEVDGNGNLGTVVACSDDVNLGSLSLSSAVFDFDPQKTYRAVVWNEGAAPQGMVIEVLPAAFDLTAPADDTAYETGAPTSFQWQVYNPAASYAFEVLRTTDTVLESLRLYNLTPAADNADSLTCDASLCTLTVEPGSELAAYMTTQGAYLWTTYAQPENDIEVQGNQVYDFIIGAVQPVNLVSNGGFESDVDGDKLPDGWTGKNLTKDKRKCNKYDPVEKIFAYEGECAFMFKGGGDGVSAENASLEQVLTGNGITVGDTLVLKAQVRGSGVGNGTKLMAKITYTGGDKLKIKMNVPEGDTPVYLQIVSAGSTVTDTVNQIKFSVRNKSAGGKWFLDDVSLEVSGSGAGILALPGANASDRQEAGSTLALPGAPGENGRAP